MRAKFWFILGSLIVASGAMSLSNGDEGKDSGDGDREKARIWESLTEQQREKLREALRGVWSDPAVISAREEVRQASDAYQSAVRDAVNRVDPEVAEIVVKLQSASEGDVRERIGGGMQPKYGPRRYGDYPMGPPGYLDKLSEEEKEQFKKAQEKARESEAVKAAKDELDLLKGEDDKLRQRRLAAHKKLRKAMIDSMAAVDPEISSHLKRVYGNDDGAADRPSDGERPKEGGRPDRKGR